MSATSHLATVKVGGQNIEYELPGNIYAETVTMVKHYTERLFKFRMTRPESFRFRSGEFVTIGLPNAVKPVFRAYSIASPFWDDELEFYSIKVPNGPLTEHLQKIQAGDTILMRKKATGTLVLDALLPGKRLFLFSTGTGIAPFASIVRDPETYEKFSEVVLLQTTRQVAELDYAREVIDQLKDDPLIGEFAHQLKFFPMTTREHSAHMGRLTDQILTGEFFEKVGVAPIEPLNDRAMICGSMAMLKDCAAMCQSFGLQEGANNAPATYVVERAFVD